MRLHFPLLSCAIAATMLSFGATPGFYSYITNLWYQGRQSNVLAIAEDRLNVNSNDFVGLLLKMEYDFEYQFDDLSILSNSIVRVVSQSEAIATPNYLKNKNRIKTNLEYLLSVIYEDSEEQRRIDAAKAGGFGKHMLFSEYLLLACIDGLATNYPAVSESLK